MVSDVNNGKVFSELIKASIVSIILMNIAQILFIIMKNDFPMGFTIGIISHIGLIFILRKYKNMKKSVDH